MIKRFINREKCKLYNDNQGRINLFPGSYLCVSLLIGLFFYCFLSFCKLSISQSLYFYSAISFILIAYFHLAPILAKSVYEDKNSLYFKTLEITAIDTFIAIGAIVLVLFKFYLLDLLAFNLIIFILSFTKWGMNYFTSLGIFFVTITSTLGAISLGLIGGLQKLENSQACKNSTLRFSQFLLTCSLLTYGKLYFDFSDLEIFCWIACFVCSIWMPRYIQNKSSLFWGIGVIFLLISALDLTRNCSIEINNYFNPVEAVFSSCQGLDPEAVQPKNNPHLWQPFLEKALSLNTDIAEYTYDDIVRIYESQYWAVRKNLEWKLQFESELKIVLFCSLYIIIFIGSLHTVKKYLT